MKDSLKELLFHFFLYFLGILVLLAFLSTLLCGFFAISLALEYVVFKHPLVELGTRHFYNLGVFAVLMNGFFILFLILYFILTQIDNPYELDKSSQE
jgi:hypothetical protein